MRTSTKRTVVEDDEKERPFISRYVVVIETTTRHPKYNTRTYHEHEAYPTLRQAAARQADILFGRRVTADRKVYIVDQDKQPDHVFTFHEKKIR